MPRPRPHLTWLLILAAVLAAAFGSRALRAVRSSETTGEAAWIWSQDSSRLVEPSVFRLVTEIELDRAPAAATLAALGDEEYVLHLNGFRVGGNAYRPGSLLDLYPVTELLVPGRNRLVAELRSQRGAGGFLASLDVDGRVVAATGESWRVYRDPASAILTGGPLPGEGESVRVWGRPPLGRWGRPRPGPHRPLWPTPASYQEKLPLSPVATPPELLAGSRLRPQTVHLFDGGRTLTGLVSLRFDEAGRGPALLFTGEEPPRPGERPADGLALLLPGARTWTDAQARRFRYLLVLAETGVTATVEEAPPDIVPRLLSPALDAEGLLGLRPPPRLSPTEAALRRRLAIEP